MGIEKKNMKISDKRVLKSFNSLMKTVNQVLLSHYDKGFVAEVHLLAEKEFKNLIPELPYIGGRKNFYNEMPLKAAIILAIYRALSFKGVNLNQFSDLLEEITIAYMETMPKLIRYVAGKLWMNPLFIRLMKKQARISKERKYIGDFVFEVVDSDSEYIWGIDYLECGIVKFLYRQEEFELAEHACKLDYLMFPAIGVKLDRSGTIAEGCKLCDFRFN